MTGSFEEAPPSQKLDQLVLSFNFLTGIAADLHEKSPNLTLLDLHNNQFQTLADSVCQLYNLKTLRISNNNLSDINPRLSLLDQL